MKQEINRLAIIGASYLQLPLIKEAKQLGYETHVFAWENGATGFEYIDKFYDIDIKDITKILEVLKQVHPCGICTIASDLANITVNELAKELNLPCNSAECVKNSTNKYLMRSCFAKHGIECPKFEVVSYGQGIKVESFKFPLIVKPTDRSGSRAITKVFNPDELYPALKNAFEQSFEKKAIVEEFLEGDEFSAECISQNGKHTLLAVTKKFTTGAPNFIETGHVEPSGFNKAELEIIEKSIYDALNALDIKQGCSHSEFKWDATNKKIKIIEIGSRMGGDFIGSDLVKYSTGHNFVRYCIDCAVGNPLNLQPDFKPIYKNVGIKYIFNQNDLDVVNKINKENVIQMDLPETIKDDKVVDSSSRLGYAIIHFDERKILLEVLNKWY